MQRADASKASALMLEGISGHVVDVHNAPIPFATINANNIVTHTDKDGNFTLPSSDTTAKVSVIAVGFKPKTINANKYNEEQKIVLEQSQQEMSEVVVTSAYSKKKLSARMYKQTSTENSELVTGWGRFNQYIEQNRKSAQALRIDSLKGEVRLSFTINKQGRPQQIKVEKSLCAAYDAEAVRLLKEGPTWKKSGSKKVYWSISF